MWEGREGRGRGHSGRDRGDLGFGRGPGRGERFLEQGDLKWLILDMLATQARHGYEVIKAIEDLFNDQYSPSPGVVYPTLTFLEETGSVASEQQGSKKLYSLTDEGRASLEANAPSVKAMKDRIDAVRVRFGGPPAPELLRAMGNLRGALQIRWSKGDMSPETLATITAAIDRAAGEIERS
jgi:DNA-binding PadR family transcriptional regulator